MAMDFMTQAMGYGPEAFETEEERRKRLEAAGNMEVKSQTVKTFADGTQEQVTKQQVAGPVVPDSTYGRMLQVESGNRDFDAQGRPVTSPKGAMFASQVMPSTAANPGFGIRPASAQTPEEYNRVGQEYFQALLQKYNGDEQKAIAAYNMGPGAVDRNIQQNQGQFNVSTAPQETQNYLRRVGERVLGAMVPSAQAATPVAPTAQPARVVPSGQTVNLANSSQNIPVRGPEIPVPPSAAPVNQALPPQQFTTTPPTAEGLAMGPPVTAITPEAYAQIEPYAQGFIDAKSPQDLMRIGSDVNAPQWAQKLAGEKLAQELRGAAEKERTTTELQQKIAAGDTLGIAKMFQDKRGQGSWAKAILLGYMGAPQLAAAELGKMGYGTTFQQAQVGNDRVLLEMRFDGLPMQGYNLRTGEKLSDLELGRATGGVMSGKVTTSGTYFQDSKTGQILVRQSDEKGNVRLLDVATKQPYEGTSVGLVKLEEAGALRKLDASRVSDLAKKHGQNVLEAEAEYVKINGPFGTTGNPVTRDQFRSAYGFELATPTGAKPTTGAATTPGAATTTAGQTSATPGRLNVPIAEQQIGVESRKAGQKEITKKAGETLGNRADLETQVKDVEKAVELLNTGKHNVGSVLSGVVGRGPIAQGIGKQFETDDAKNTNTIMDTVNKLAADGLKTLGSNPSTVDLEFWTRYKPNLSSDPDFVKQWIGNAKQRIESRIGSAEQQLQSGGAPGSGSINNRPGVSNW
jgi:soluble lytic murein transglycosylase